VINLTQFKNIEQEKKNTLSTKQEGTRRKGTRRKGTRRKERKQK
jgi:hypothetical protein